MARERGGSPSDRQLRDWAQRMDRVSWKAQVDKLIVYRRRDSEVDEADGYPSGGEGRGSGPTLKVETEDGSTELVPCTVVEAAALRQSRPDPFHKAVVSAFDMLQQAVMSTDAMTNHLRLLDHMGKDVPVDVKVCQVCSRAGVEHPPAPGVGAVSHGGQLPTSLWMCEAARFVTMRRLAEWRKTHPGQSPSWEDIVPLDDEIVGHEATGRWRIHT